ncbi:hypothetical protein FG062_02390 [Vibrio cholerae]|nr:hypothetical protein [Vibrio cholerae]EGR0598460.1 hypothetical protein [Vibrio cholerae]MVC36111.1 hypothetical protein [Vibrio cholerae]
MANNKTFSAELEIDQLSGAEYNKLMQQGGDAFKSCIPLDQNPHLDGESRAAWFEGWQWQAYHSDQEVKH